MMTSDSAWTQSVSERAYERACLTHRRHDHRERAQIQRRASSFAPRVRRALACSGNLENENEVQKEVKRVSEDFLIPGHVYSRTRFSQGFRNDKLRQIDLVLE